MGRASIHIFFRCSIQKLKLIHISMLGDGDTKSIEEINLNKHFGPHITVTKEECVSHIAKRLYTRLKYLGQKGAVDERRKKVRLSSKNGLTKLNDASFDYFLQRSDFEQCR